MRSILTTCALVASASAHTIFQELYVNGVSQGHTTGIRVPNYDGCVPDYRLASFVCTASRSYSIR